VKTDTSLIRDMFGGNMLTLDGPHHARLRETDRGMFAPSLVKWRFR
jgi:cytochrome P450